MKSSCNRLTRLCMAGMLTLALTLQPGVTIPIFAETTPTENREIPENDGSVTELPAINETSEADDPAWTEAPDGDEENSGVDVRPDRESPEAPDDESENQTETEPPEINGQFSDTQDHWAADIIDYWVERAAVTGYPDGSFLPDHSISRAEAASLTSRIRGLTGSDQPVFRDVPADSWAFESVQACYTFSILKGTGGDLFQPADSITREAAMTLICRASSLNAAGREESLRNLPDQDEISDWARNAVAILLQEGVVTGDQEGLLHPGDPVTRAEFLTMLYRLETRELWNPALQDQFALIDPKWIVTVQNSDPEDPAELTIVPSNLGEQTVILPEFADLHNIRLDCTLNDPNHTTILCSGNKGTVSGTALDLTELSWRDQEGMYPLTVSVTDGEIQRDYHFNMVYGTSLDAMFLSSDEASGKRFYVDQKKGNSVPGTMRMLSCNGEILYDGNLTQLKSRGNSTFEYAKKPYQIKLDQKTDLIGNGEKVKTWVLLANYADPTMLKDKLCKDLAADFQLPGTPDCQWVDLYFDGEYRGVYLLTEKIQISSTGLEITDLEEMYEEVNPDYGEEPVAEISKNKYGNQIQYIEDLVSPEDIRNGYLLELNNSQYDEISGFITRRGKGVNIKAPEYLNREGVEFISEYYQEFEDAVYAVNMKGIFTGINSRTRRSFTEYCDLDSMARMYLLYQFSMNADAYFGSTYFYMEDGILHQGPIWDGDLSFGIVWDEVHQPDHKLQNSYMSEALERLPVFRRAVKELYDSEFRDLELRYTQEVVNRYREELSLSESRNHLIWPLYYRIAAFDMAWPKDATYTEVISDLKQWMSARIDYLDEKFQDWEK